MSELKAIELGEAYKVFDDDKEFYLKSEADQHIEGLEESHKKEVEQLLMEIGELNHKVDHWETWYKQAAKF